MGDEPSGRCYAGSDVTVLLTDAWVASGQGRLVVFQRPVPLAPEVWSIALVEAGRVVIRASGRSWNAALDSAIALAREAGLEVQPWDQ